MTRSILFLFCSYAWAQSTSVMLTTSPSSTSLGQPVTLTASVTPAATAGKVTFYDGVSILGIRTLSGGQALLTTTLLPSGMHSLRAYYGGGSTYTASTSATLPLTVNAVQTNTFQTLEKFPTRVPDDYVDFTLPAAIAVGDFNGDGRPDLVVQSLISATVSILLGNSLGTFQSPVNYRTGVSATIIVVADFNGDGKADLVVNNQQGSNIAILFGNGDGSFQPAVSYNVGSSNTSVAAADFNGDGKADLAVASGSSVFILLGNGDGTFQTPVSYPTVGKSGSLVVGDFNGDGKADLAVTNIAANNNISISVLLGNGDGTFKSPVSYPAGLGQSGLLATGDFRGIGTSDLAVADQLSNTVTVLPGKGDGTFRPAVLYTVGDPGTGITSLAFGDANGDGKADLIVIPNSGADIRVLPGNGDGSFANVAIYPVADQGMTSLALADFNGDGQPDVAFADFQGVGILPGALIIPPTTTLKSSSNPSIYGQQVVLTAVVSPPAASGSVAFYDGPTPLGTIPLVNSQSTLTNSLLSVGTHSLSAVYEGGATNVAGYSNNLLQTVNRAASVSTTTLSASANPATLGQDLTLMATISPASATGSVTFYDGTSVLGSATLTSGRAAFATSLLPSGNRSLIAIYSGDVTYAASSSALALKVQTLPATRFQAVNMALLNTVFPLQTVTWGDFNGDGRPDFAVASLSGNVRIYLGIGDGTFRLASILTAVTTPTSIAIADFNRDGKADLVVTDLNSNIEVFLGNGDGTFQSPLNIALSGGARAISVVVGDFNGDGKPDLVVAGGFVVVSGIYLQPISYFEMILLGNGDGTFQSPRIFSLKSAFIATADPNAIAVADFNGDGKADLVMVVPNQLNGSLFFFMGNGDGTFQPPVSYSPFSANTTGSYAVSVTVADLNGDGKADIIVLNPSGLGILINNGDGTFQSAVNYPTTSPNSVAVGDFDGDGKVDLAVAVSGNSIGILSGKGDGTFSPSVSYTVGSNPTFIAAGDFNGDGRTDLAVFPTGSLSVLLGAGPTLTPTSVTLASSMYPSTYGQSVTLTATVSPAAATGNVTFYDATSVLGTGILVNGQATLTTSLLSTGTRSLTATYVGSGTYAPSTSATLALTVSPVAASGFQTPVNYTLPGYALSVAVGDFNRDGKADLALPRIYGNGVTVMLGNGDGTFRVGGSFAAGNYPTSVAVGDFNGDGIPDLAVANWGDGNVSVLLGNGDGTFQAAVNYAAGNLPKCVAVGDFNGDGVSDLAVSNYSDNTVSVLLGKGDGTFQAAVNYVAGSDPIAVVVSDFNGDGRADLAVANYADNTVSVLLGKGDGTFQAAVNYAAGFGPNSVAVGDFNGDGKPDLAVVDRGDNSVSVLLGNGDGTFQALTNYPVSGQPFSIVVADINGDGRADLVVACSEGGVFVLLGNGHGGFQFPSNYPTGTQLYGVAVGDFNADGRTDLAVTGQNSTLTILLGKPSLAGAKMPGSRVGVFRYGTAFLEDSNGNATYDPGVDRYIPNFNPPGGSFTGDYPVVGDWTGDGNAKIGIYRSSTGTWFLDANNNGIYDAGDYTYQFGGLAGDIPFAGDWNGLGKSCIGLYRSNGSVWLLDLNCSGTFENAPNDAFFPFGGIAGDVPVVGAWTGGTTRVGVVRKYAPAGIPQGNPFYWVLDGSAANAGSAVANHQPGFTFAFGGLPGDVFVTGDWYNNGTSGAAVYRAGFWVLDAALPAAPQASHMPGLTFGYGGVAVDVPIVGKW